MADRPDNDTEAGSRSSMAEALTFAADRLTAGSGVAGEVIELGVGVLELRMAHT